MRRCSARLAAIARAVRVLRLPAGGDTALSRVAVSRAAAGRFFRGAHRAVFRAFPDYPPFAGKFTTVVPHVTVAHADEPQLCEIEVELRIALARRWRRGALQRDGAHREFQRPLGRDAALRARRVSKNPTVIAAHPRRLRRTAGRAGLRDMIRKLSSGKYRLYSRKPDPKTGRRRNLGTFATRAARRETRARSAVLQAPLMPASRARPRVDSRHENRHRRAAAQSGSPICVTPVLSVSRWARFWRNTVAPWLADHGLVDCPRYGVTLDDP